VLPTLATDSVDLVVTSPPYWQILHKKDHKARQEREEKGLATRYSEDDARDLGNIEDYGRFLKELVGIFAECGRVLRPRQHMCVVVGDFRDGGRYRMFHADLAAAMEEQTPFVLKGLTILYQAHKRVFPYGYPAAFVPNLHHQYIVIMRNEK
jgi:DNA modification methylase